jgi:hypothetical protein
MSYVFIWDSMRNEMYNNLFLKTLGASLIGEGFTLSNFVMISDNNECVLLDLPFGNAVKGEVYLLNNKGIAILEKFYDKFSKKKISCYYNSCGCSKDVYEKINCIIYCINKPELIENYIKKISKKTFIIESGDWKSYSNTESLNN